MTKLFDHRTRNTKELANNHPFVTTEPVWHKGEPGMVRAVSEVINIGVGQFKLEMDVDTALEVAAEIINHARRIRKNGH